MPEDKSDFSGPVFFTILSSSISEPNRSLRHLLTKIETK